LIRCYFHVRVRFTYISSRNQIVTERNNIGSIAAIVFQSKVKHRRVILCNERVDAQGVGAPKLIDALIGVGERNEHTHLTHSLDHPPFGRVRILKLIENDYWVGGR